MSPEIAERAFEEAIESGTREGRQLTTPRAMAT